MEQKKAVYQMSDEFITKQRLQASNKLCSTENMVLNYSTLTNDICRQIQDSLRYLFGSYAPIEFLPLVRVM